MSNTWFKREKGYILIERKLDRNLLCVGKKSTPVVFARYVGISRRVSTCLVVIDVHKNKRRKVVRKMHIE